MKERLTAVEVANLLRINLCTLYKLLKRVNFKPSKTGVIGGSILSK